MAAMASSSLLRARVPRLCPRASGRGFSLLELMIVIAIIVILALIALPGIPDKFVRDRIVEAVKLADIVKPPIAASWAATGTMPVDNAAAGLPAADKIVNEYISSVAVESGAIQVTFGNRANVAIQGKVLSLRPGVIEDARIVPVSWVCGHAEPPGQDDRARPRQDRRAAALPAAQLPRVRGLGAVIEIDGLASRQRQPALGGQGAALAGLDRGAQPHLALGERARGGRRRPGADAGGRPRAGRRRRARPAALDARPHRLVPGALDRAQRAARCAASAPTRRIRAWPRSCRRPISGTTRRARAVAAARARRRRAARPGGDARLSRRDARDDARAARRPRRRGRRVALLPSPRALPRGDARRGVRRARADARLRQRPGRRASRRGRRARRCSSRRRAGCSARAAPAFASTTRPSRIRSTCPSSRSMRRP